jgi:hypothetical protein
MRILIIEERNKRIKIMFNLIQTVEVKGLKLVSVFAKQVSKVEAQQIMININRGLNRSDRAALVQGQKRGFSIVAA